MHSFTSFKSNRDECVDENIEYIVYICQIYTMKNNLAFFSISRISHDSKNNLNADYTGPLPCNIVFYRRAVQAIVRVRRIPC